MSPRKPKTAEPFVNRIVGDGDGEPGQLLANPANWRVHPKQQQAALSGVLSRVGWVQRVIVNQRTGHVVDGHLRVALALSRGEATVPVLYVDLSPEEEALVLATLDPVAGMAATDATQLGDLLTSLSGEDGKLDSPVIGYQLIFDDEAQQERWFAFLRDLKQKYPAIETIAGRLDEALRDWSG